MSGHSDAAPRRRVVSALTLLRSIREGLNREALMARHGLSPEELDHVLNQIQKERDRRARRILEDFVRGMSAKDIARRNEFPVDQFLRMFRLAVSLRIRPPEIPTAGAESTSVPEEAGERRRRLRVTGPVLKTRVRDASRSDIQGVIHDISEEGLGVRGVGAEVGEQRTFLINEEGFDPADRIALTCTCRWAHSDRDAGAGDSSGFELTAISEDNRSRLSSWIDAESRMCGLQP